MCVILDANTWHSVLGESSKDHCDFVALHNWIYKGQGRIVYGGTKYKEELSKAEKYLWMFIELGKIKKTVKICDNEVDQKQEEVENMLQNSNFDDAHIVAIVIISGCRLICSKNKRHIPFFKNKDLYPEKFGQVKIYNRQSHSKLLSDRSIMQICRLCRSEKKK